MKFNKFALTLTAAVLLPTFAHAAADEVIASFERDFVRGPVKSAVTTGNPDAFTTEFYAALNNKIDPVLASFERDMYRTPITASVAHGEDDVLTMEFYAALRDVLDRPTMCAAVAGNGRSGS